MSKEEEIQLAWTIWHLIARLNELIWNRYENEFIERYLKLEEEKYWQSQAEDKGPIWDTK
jgi:hypothetical protein